MLKITHTVLRRFAYPLAFKSLPEYSARRGNIVQVTRALRRGDEYDYCGQGMYEIRDPRDGWTGVAYYSELEKIDTPEYATGAHPAVLHGQCPACLHWGDDCTGVRAP